MHGGVDHTRRNLCRGPGGDSGSVQFSPGVQGDDKEAAGSEILKNRCPHRKNKDFKCISGKGLRCYELFYPEKRL